MLKLLLPPSSPSPFLHRPPKLNRSESRIVVFLLAFPSFVFSSVFLFFFPSSFSPFRHAFPPSLPSSHIHSLLIQVSPFYPPSVFHYSSHLFRSLLTSFTTHVFPFHPSSLSLRSLLIHVFSFHPPSILNYSSYFLRSLLPSVFLFILFSLTLLSLFGFYFFSSLLSAFPSLFSYSFPLRSLLLSFFPFHLSFPILILLSHSFSTSFRFSIPPSSPFQYSFFSSFSPFFLLFLPSFPLPLIFFLSSFSPSFLLSTSLPSLLP